MPRRQYRHILLAAVLLLAGIAALLFLPATLARHRQQGAAPRAHTTTPQAFPVTLTDALDNTVTINAPPARIISLSPNVTEILFAVGAGERVIAATTYCDYPPAAANLPKVGGYLDPNVERIIALSPDLVVGARGTRREVFTHLASLGIPVLAVDPLTLAEVADVVRFLGRAVGERASAEKLAGELEARRQAVLARTRGIPETERPRVLFLFTTDGLYSAGPGSHIDHLISEAGGRNIAGRAPIAWPQLSLESIVAENPEAILLLTGNSMAEPMTAERALAHFTRDARWGTVAAVRAHRIILLDEDAVTIPGPRMADALEELARALHPEGEPRE